MTLKFLLVFILVAVAMVARHSSAASMEGGNYTARLVGDEINEEEEMMMDSEASRRILASGKRFISYAALKANSVPCSNRGRSYYACSGQGRKKANPYKRACTTITKCYRFTH